MPERKRGDREGTEELCSVTVGNDKKHLAFIFSTTERSEVVLFLRGVWGVEAEVA